MATYKVIQDIEAEDKLLGPLTLRQFIYAGICVLCIYLGFIAIVHGLDLFIVILLPVALLSGFFAFPWKLNQPTETWALAMIRFFVKPRKRIWNQSGIKELVTITAPKVEPTNYTNNLTEGEVKGRLKTLAAVLDSRGWAVKNSPSSFNYRSASDLDSDRLITITPTNPIAEVSDVPVTADILDDSTNPTAQRFNDMISSSSESRFDGIKNRLNTQQAKIPSSINSDLGSLDTAGLKVTKQNSDWFIKQPSFAKSPTSTDSISSNIGSLRGNVLGLDGKLRTRHQDLDMADPNLRTLSPPSATPIRPTQNTGSATVTQPPNPVILNFASNNDLNIATLAREVNRQQGNGLQGEVIVQLH